MVSLRARAPLKEEFYCLLESLKWAPRALKWPSQAPFPHFPQFCGIPDSQKHFSYHRLHWQNQIRAISFTPGHETSTLSSSPPFQLFIACSYYTFKKFLQPSFHLSGLFLLWLINIRNSRRTCLALQSSPRGPGRREGTGTAMVGFPWADCRRWEVQDHPPGNKALPPRLPAFLCVSPLTLCVVKAAYIVHSTGPTGIEILGAGGSLWLLPFEEQPWFSDSTPDNSIHLTDNDSSGMAVICGSFSFRGGNVKNFTGGDNLHRQEFTEYLFYSGPKRAAHCHLLLQSPLIYLHIFISEQPQRD